jgi:hypothetical protein
MWFVRFPVETWAFFPHLLVASWVEEKTNNVLERFTRSIKEKFPDLQLGILNCQEPH